MSMKESEMSDLENQSAGASMAPINDGEAVIADADEESAIDDQGTDQSEAVEILKQVRDAAFDSSDEKLALALGRTSEEVSEWLNGEAKVDSDALIKIRALAAERGVEIQ
jgi:hypothetical protein